MSWIIVAIIAAFFIRPAVIFILPDEMCGPNGWLIDTNADDGWFGGCSDGDGGGD